MNLRWVKRNNGNVLQYAIGGYLIDGKSGLTWADVPLESIPDEPKLPRELYIDLGLRIKTTNGEAVPAYSFDPKTSDSIKFTESTPGYKMVNREMLKSVWNKHWHRNSDSMFDNMCKDLGIE